MRSNNYQEKLVICITHASMRMQFSQDPSPREGTRSGARNGLGYPMHRNILTYRPFNAFYAAVTY